MASLILISLIFSQIALSLSNLYSWIFYLPFVLTMWYFPLSGMSLFAFEKRRFKFIVVHLLYVCHCVCWPFETSVCIECSSRPLSTQSVSSYCDSGGGVDVKSPVLELMHVIDVLCLCLEPPSIQGVMCACMHGISHLPLSTWLLHYVGISLCGRMYVCSTVASRMVDSPKLGHDMK